MNSKQLENYGISPPLTIHQFLIPLNFQSPWGKLKSYSVFSHSKTGNKLFNNTVYNSRPNNSIQLNMNINKVQRTCS